MKKSKKPVKKIVKKTVKFKKVKTYKVAPKKKNVATPTVTTNDNIVTFSVDGTTLTKSEMKFYKNMMKRLLPIDLASVGNVGEAHPDVKSPSVQIAEQNILGENYERVMTDTNTQPGIADKEFIAPAIELSHEDTSLSKNYGVLVDVANKFGCSKESFGKLMDFMIANKIVLVGSLLDYNLAVKEFINEAKDKIRKEEAEKLIAEKEAYEKSNEKLAEDNKIENIIAETKIPWDDDHGIMHRND